MNFFWVIVKRKQGKAGTIDRGCNFITKIMNCPEMYHGWVYEDGEMETRIFREECMQNACRFTSVQY